VLEERLTYLIPAKLRRLDRAQKAAMSAAQGDVLEFGIALGGSGVLLAQEARRNSRRFAGFDVFATIPPPTSEKDDEKSKERYARIASGTSVGIAGEPYYGYMTDLFERVSQTFQRHGTPVDGQNVQLVKGLFEDTWPRFETASVAFAHLDCDWYDPVKYCLEAVDQKMPVGGAIVLDDYNDYGGAKVATDEFLGARPGRYQMDPGPNVILRRVA
jgi:asparagine synthase (glutamine-hydrolysing)